MQSTLQGGILAPTLKTGNQSSENAGHLSEEPGMNPQCFCAPITHHRIFFQVVKCEPCEFLYPWKAWQGRCLLRSCPHL